MPPRSPRQPLSRERVLGAAIRIADAQGLGAVTMRAVAADLGVEAMSLYHHVAGKQELLDGLVKALIAEIEDEIRADSQPVDGWQPTLRRRCLAARNVMERHRWAPGLFATRTSAPSSLYPYYEQILATMVTGGLSYHLAHRALHALGSMALGFVQELFSAGADAADAAEEGAGEAELAAMTAALPHLTAMVAAELHDAGDDPLGWCDSRAEFEFTLDLLLDGLARAASVDAQG